MNEHYLDLVRQILDRQVVDANHYNCGKVDDIEIDLDGKPKVTGIFVGNDLASDRLPELARFISKKIFGRRRVKIPWSEILRVADDVKLAKSAEEYGLDERKGFAFDIVNKLPGAWQK